MPIVPYQYSYLIATLLFFIPWSVLYIHRKDLHKEMTIMGIITAIIGVLAEYFWFTADWWHPLTVTNSRIGIEDVLLGFSNGGIVAVLYEELFKKQLYLRIYRKHRLKDVLVFLIPFSTTAILFWGIKTTSFIATSVGIGITGVLLIYSRKDLFRLAFITGILMLIVALPFYISLITLSPGYIETMWYHEKLSGIRIHKIPIEEFVFFFLAGFMISPLYEYWLGDGLRTLPQKNRKRK